MASVALEHVSKTYDGDVPAVRDVSVTVADGEFVVLVGPSGCGKSTLLRMVAGLETPTAGTVRIGERVVNDVPPKDRDVAMVFQNYALYPHMSVRKNLSFGLRLRKTPRAEIAGRVEAAASLLGIGDLLDRKPGQLSGGQRQRVALGRAIVRDPAVFLFDEPLSNLDAQLRGEMRRELAALHRRLGTTSVYVTHDQTEAMTLGDRVVVLNKGEIQQSGPPLELYDRPANRFVAGFLGSPPMNLIDGTLTTDNGETIFRWNDHAIRIPPHVIPALPPAGTGLTLGVRPEDLHPVDSTTEMIGESHAVFRGPIDEVQPLGGESLIHFDASGTAMTAKMSSQVPWQRGRSAEFTADAARLQWFGDDGRRLGDDGADPSADPSAAGHASRLE